MTKRIDLNGLKQSSSIDSQGGPLSPQNSNQFLANRLTDIEKLKSALKRQRSCQTSSPSSMQMNFQKTYKLDQKNFGSHSKPNLLNDNIINQINGQSRTRTNREHNMTALQKQVSNDPEPKTYPIMRLFTIYGVNYAAKIKEIVDEQIQQEVGHQQLEQAILSMEIKKPQILGWVDKNSVNGLEMDVKQYLKKNYPYTDALSQVAFPEHDMKKINDNAFFRISKVTPSLFQEHKKFYTYISTDFQGQRIYIQSLQYTKVVQIQVPQLQYCGLYSVIESMQISSAGSAPIIGVMTNFLQFIFDTVIKPRNDRLLKEEEDNQTDVINIILSRGPEFIASVVFQHLHFQTNILHNISLQFPEQKIEYNFRNVYLNNSQFKIENFNFELLFKKINNIDKILQLLSSLLLEKKVIIVKEDISDVAILMQTLITLLSPFKWNYSVITNLPVEMIEALESPQPFLIGIQKSIWDSHCRIETMDNIKEENFVIFDVDQLETRGLHDIYDDTHDSIANIQLQKDFKKKYQQLLSLKDELISQLTQGNKKKTKGEKEYTEEKAEELYWVWFQLKIKQAMHHLYLNMVGNVQAAFKSEDILKEMDRIKGDNISCKDIFDFPKYRNIMTKEMKSEKLKFMEAFVEKQGFIVFIEDLYAYKREKQKGIRSSIDKENSDSQVKTEMTSFYQSLKFLTKIEQNEGQSTTDYVKFSEKALKQLRTKQNQQIDQIYLKYKNPVPFKFQFIMDEYIKQLCIKNKKVTAEECRELSKSDLQQKAHALICGYDKTNHVVIEQDFLTSMKGIDYDKIQEYLNRLKQKKNQEKEKRKQLKSQNSMNRGLSSRQEFLSENDSDQKLQSEAKFGFHNRHASSTTENLQMFGNPKLSKSSRRENINSQSLQQLIMKERTASFVAGSNLPNFQQTASMQKSMSRNQLDEQSKTFQSKLSHKDLNKTLKTAKVAPSRPYYEFLDDKQELERSKNAQANVNNSLKLNIPQSMCKSQSYNNFMTNSNQKMFRNSQESVQDFQKFQKALLSKQDSVENLYQKVEKRNTMKLGGHDDSQRLQLSRQSDQSGLKGMKPPQHQNASNVFSPTKFRLMQQRSSQALPNSVALRKEASSPKNVQASMSTLSMGKNSGNSYKDDPMKKSQALPSQNQFHPLMTTNQTFDTQAYSQTGQNGAQEGRKSAQQLGSGQMTQLGLSQPQQQRRAFNQSQQTIALLNPMIIQSPSGVSGGTVSGGKLSNGQPVVRTPGVDNSGLVLFQKHQSVGPGAANQTSSNEGGSKNLSSSANQNIQSPSQSKLPLVKKLSGVSSNFSMRNLPAPGSGQKTRNYNSPNRFRIEELKTSKTTRDGGGTKVLKSPTRISFQNPQKTLDKSATTIMTDNNKKSANPQPPNSAKSKQQSSKLQQFKSQISQIMGTADRPMMKSPPTKSSSTPMMNLLQSSANKPPITNNKTIQAQELQQNDVEALQTKTVKKIKKTRVAKLDLSKEIQQQRANEVQNQYYQVKNYIKTDEDLMVNEQESPQGSNSSLSEENKSRHSCYSNQLIQASYEGMKELRVPKSQRLDAKKTLQNDTLNLSSGASSGRYQTGIYAPITTQIDQGITYQTAQSDSINEGNQNRIGVRNRYTNRKPSMRYDDKPNRESTLSDIALSNQECTEQQSKLIKHPPQPVDGKLAVNTQSYVQAAQNNKAKKPVKTQRYEDSNYYAYKKPKPIKSQRANLKVQPVETQQEPEPNFDDPNLGIKNGFQPYEQNGQPNSELSDSLHQENVQDSSRHDLQAAASLPSYAEKLKTQYHRPHIVSKQQNGNQKILEEMQLNDSNLAEQAEQAAVADPASTMSASSHYGLNSHSKTTKDNGKTFQEAQKHMKQNKKQTQKLGPVLNSTVNAGHASKYNITGGTPDEMASPWIQNSIQSKQSSGVAEYKDQQSGIKLRMQANMKIQEFQAESLYENRSLFSPTGLKSPSLNQKQVQRVSITANQKKMKKYYNQKFTSQKLDAQKMCDAQFVPSFQNKLNQRPSQLSKHEEDISMSLSLIDNEFSILSSARNNLFTPKVESRHKFINSTKTIDPSGEHLMDLHRYYQPNQMISSHIGDIDNEPRTPHNDTKSMCSPNWQNNSSMQNSQSK